MIVFDRLWATMKRKGVSQYRLIQDYKFSTGNSSQPIELYIDGAKFARITGPYNSGETRRRGVSLVTGGA